MEHQQYDLMRKLQKKFPNSINSFQPPSYFQESFVWPPRSYRCNFCSREFRSAQALGGHMNVHRRDRARLKQSPPPPPLPLLQPQQADHYSLFQEKSLPQTNLFTPRNVDEECDSEENDDFVGKRHKLMCSSESFSSMEEEIDLELRLGYPVVKL